MMNTPTKLNKCLLILSTSTLLGTAACGALNSAGANDRFDDGLLFYASFDTAATADFARGDPRLYSAPSREQLDAASSNLQFAPAVSIAHNQGKYGGALEFKNNVVPAVFYKAANNVKLKPQNWSGTIAFWLKIDPDQDLSKNYVDPIQITETSHRNAAIWTDFTTTNNKRMFRLGVAGDEASWTSSDKDIATKGFYHRVRGILDPPFSGDRWTHVVITHDQLGSSDASAHLYLDGQRVITHQPIKDPFTWQHNNANIYLGLRYSGFIDELLIFDRSFTAAEITQLQNKPRAAVVRP